MVIPDDFAVDPENNEFKTATDFAQAWKDSTGKSSQSPQLVVIYSGS